MSKNTDTLLSDIFRLLDEEANDTTIRKTIYAEYDKIGKDLENKALPLAKQLRADGNVLAIETFHLKAKEFIFFNNVADALGKVATKEPDEVRKLSNWVQILHSEAPNKLAVLKQAILYLRKPRLLKAAEELWPSISFEAEVEA